MNILTKWALVAALTFIVAGVTAPAAVWIEVSGLPALSMIATPSMPAVMRLPPASVVMARIPTLEDW